MPKKSKEELSKEEIKIIRELQKHSIRDIDLIAKQCGVSRQKIWKTIKKLEQQKVIWGHTTIIGVEPQNLQKYILLLKKTTIPITEQVIDNISEGRLQTLYTEFGITIESSHYLHGEYDWVLLFTARDLRHAKKFSGLLLENFPGLVAKTTLLQIMYSQKLHHIINPDKKKLKEFL